MRSAQRVLLVEDEMMVAEVLGRMLTEFGYEVLGPATDVAEALAMIASETFEAAVLDVNLEGQMSYCVADALSKRGVPFLFSTGYQKDSLRRGYSNRPVLQKPFRSHLLKQAVETMLAKRDPGIARLN